ncbi:unnamed protein product [Discosporangium mesarthrocarpum]
MQAGTGRFLAGRVPTLAKIFNRCNSGLAHHKKQRSVIIRRDVGVRIIELQRAQVLNPADERVIAAIQQQLGVWEDNWMVQVAVLQGRRGSFCSGMDIDTVSEDPGKANVLLRGLCQVVRSLASFNKPVISIIDGSCFGSGYALAMGKYKICTERSLFTVPEPSRGLALAGGLSYTLPRLLGGNEALALCLGMTGLTLEGANMHAAQLGTHWMPSSRLKPLIDRLNEVWQAKPDTFLHYGIACEEGPKAVEIALEMSSDLSWETQDLMDFSFAERGAGDMVPHQTQFHRILPEVEEAFAVGSVEEAVQNLKNCSGSWANVALKNIARSSPLSLKVVFEQIKRGKTMSLDQCLEDEYRVNSSLLSMPDFQAAMSIQCAKDGMEATPCWSRRTLNEVSADDVISLFEQKEN